MNIKNFFVSMILMFAFCVPAFAEQSRSATTTMSFTIPSYFKIESVTSPVLVANITDDTGNMYSNLSTQFKVISNSSEKKKLYLNSVINTNGGREDSMFIQGGRVYVAFGNLQKPPTLNSLNNCKIGSRPNDSPGVVAYPITSIFGAKSSFNRSENKYEVYVGNGVSYITVNLGSQVLRNSFGTNDPKGAYQAILSLTEAQM